MNAAYKEFTFLMALGEWLVVCSCVFAKICRLGILKRDPDTPMLWAEVLNKLPPRLAERFNFSVISRLEVNKKSEFNSEILVSEKERPPNREK